jgi:tetratricopeptide (TPR) repeat protein
MTSLTRLIKNALLLILLVLIIYHPPQRAGAASLSDTVSSLNAAQISSFNEMKAALTILQSSCMEAKQKKQLTFNLQKLILSQSGKCISQIVALEQKSDVNQDTKRKEARDLFLKNRVLIKDILTWNQKKVEDLQEHKLDQMENTEVFFNSPEWQEPQYLISLASYWLSWNGHYSSLLYPSNDPSRKNLLDEAVDGFSRTFIDFKEESIVRRSLFGRALCYKETQQYDKAINDFNLLLDKIKSDDDLYLRSHYEKVLISYLTGNYQSALSQLKTFRKDVSTEGIPQTMDTGFKKLQVKIILALSEKEAKKKGKDAHQYYRDALQELKKLAEHDERQAGEIYRFVNEHALMLDNISCDELGSVGCLAIADWNFNQKQYDKAVIPYQRLTSSSDTMIRKRMDDIYFRLGYCYSQKGMWQDAVSCFESLFKKFPRSSFTDEAACLYYVAATNSHKKNPRNSAYLKYIEATKNYLKHCNDTKDKSEAHFQLGKYYQDKGNTKKALKEFSRVNKDSPNYTEARYYVVQSNIDRLESYNRRGLHKSKSAKKIYHDTLRQFEQYQNLAHTQKAGAGTQELEAQMTLLQTKLFIYGPDKTFKKAIQKLNRFEKRFPSHKKLHLMAKSLRMECYRNLQMDKEARKEINSFLKEGFSYADRWAFLHECASKFYEEAERLREGGHTRQASQQAEKALMVYSELSSIASKNKHYNKFYDSIQLRKAEILRDENQTAKAKLIYQEKLKSDPTSADAIYNLGLIYEKEGQWEEAIATWRKFSRGLKAGSYYWFESRYHTATVLSRQGKGDEACEIITVIQVLYPELRDEQFKNKFTGFQNETCRKGLN